MKVLYVLANYPQASESYIEAEIRYAQSRGIEIAVLTSVRGYGEEIPGVQLFYDLPPYIATSIFQPDLIHVHYLVTAEILFKSLFCKLPVTVRAHSFDWSLPTAAHIASVPNVRAI